MTTHNKDDNQASIPADPIVLPPDPALESLAQSLRDRIARTVALGEQLGTSIQEWMSEEPYRVQTVIAPDRLSWELRMEAGTPPFATWSGVFGDAIHNLRAALDNLAWGLATLDGNEPKRPKAIQFPIVGKQVGWATEARRIAELPEIARTAIESIQPFQRTGQDDTAEGDALLLLSRLNNTDKHRLAIQPQLNPTELSHSFSVDFGSDEVASQNVPPDVTISADVFVDGTTLLRQVTKTPIVTVAGQYTFEGRVVVLDPTLGAMGVTTVLAQLATYVPQVLDHVLMNVAIARADTTGPTSVGR